jgi:hypothetical protein
MSNWQAAGFEGTDSIQPLDTGSAPHYKRESPMSPSDEIGMCKSREQNLLSTSGRMIADGKKTRFQEKSDCSQVAG